MTDIIERKLGYNNKEMLDSLYLIKKTLLTEETINKGTKAKPKLITRKKFDVKPELLERIERSVEFYQTTDEPESICDDLDESEFSMRDYQTEIIKKGTEIILNHGFVHLTMQVRTGKTLTALGICDNLFVDNVLFITKLKAIDSIKEDYAKFNPAYALTVMNYESVHNLPDIKWDVIIIDESHRLGAFPKPSLGAKQVKELIEKNKSMVILMSGTPTPETFSQMYHQVYGIPGNPFSKYKNFYRFADDYVDVKQKKLGGMMINDYSRGKETIIEAMKPYTISFTQTEAGFVVNTEENVLFVKMKDSTYSMIDKLKKNLVLEGKDEVILGDTAVKLMSKMHQMFSGTVKFESGKSMVFDLSKVEYIKSQFANRKIGIFYKFKEELNALKTVYGDGLTTELKEFDSTDKSIALQILSGREGISLRNAEYLVYYNIDFSATSYWQSRDRMTTIDRLKNDVYWIFSEGGIEEKIYKVVTKKKDFTLRHFKKAFMS
jgi:hypothetical protein